MTNGGNLNLFSLFPVVTVVCRGLRQFFGLSVKVDVSVVLERIELNLHKHARQL